MGRAAMTEVPVEVFAAADPTTTWSFTEAVDLRNHEYCAFIFTATETAPTSYEAKLQVSPDNLVWTDVPTNEVSAGLGPQRARIYQLQDEDGTVLSAAGDDRALIEYYRAAFRYVRAAVKRTGGAGTDRIAVGAIVGEE